MGCCSSTDGAARERRGESSSSSASSTQNRPGGSAGGDGAPPPVWPAQDDQVRDGATYVGDLVGGVRHGHGTARWPNGTSYAGEWRQGQYFGRGVARWENGESYVGEWRENTFHGHGSYRFASGYHYEGGFVNGLMHAPMADFLFPDGARIRGRFEDDRLNGWTEFYPPPRPGAGPGEPPPERVVQHVNGIAPTVVRTMMERRTRGPQPEVPNTWACPVCTFRNSDNVVQCVMCGRGNAADARAALGAMRQQSEYDAAFDVEPVVQPGGGGGGPAPAAGGGPLRRVASLRPRAPGRLPPLTVNGGRRTDDDQRQQQPTSLAAASAGRMSPRGADGAAAAAAEAEGLGLTREESLAFTAACVICLCEPRTHALVPCGHMCLCADCLAQQSRMKWCPMCRGDFSAGLEVQIEGASRSCGTCGKADGRTHAAMPCGHLAVCDDCASSTVSCPVCSARVRSWHQIYMLPTDGQQADDGGGDNDEPPTAEEEEEEAVGGVMSAQESTVPIDLDDISLTVTGGSTVAAIRALQQRHRQAEAGAGEQEARPRDSPRPMPVPPPPQPAAHANMETLSLSSTRSSSESTGSTTTTMTPTSSAATTSSTTTTLTAD